MKNKNKNVYPCFQSTFKCIDTFNKFTQGTSYEITGYGTDKRGGEKVSVWYITSLDFEEEEFTIIKTTLNKLIDKRIIKLTYESA